MKILDLRNIDYTNWRRIAESLVFESEKPSR